MTQHPKIYVAGHRGMVGSAIVRHLLANGQPAERIVTRKLCNGALETCLNKLGSQRDYIRYNP